MKLMFMTIGIILGLLCGLFGIILHNYEVNKCDVVSENPYYESEADCYLPMVKPEWNLFWNVIGLSVIWMFVFGFIGLMIDVERGW